MVRIVFIFYFVVKFVLEFIGNVWWECFFVVDVVVFGEWYVVVWYYGVWISYNVEGGLCRLFFVFFVCDIIFVFIYFGFSCIL